MLMTLFSEGEVNMTIIMEEVGEIVTEAGEELGVNLTVGGVQQFGEFPVLASHEACVVSRKVM